MERFDQEVERAMIFGQDPDERGEIVERWLLSETDERWYKLEAWRDKWVTLKMAKRVAISG